MSKGLYFTAIIAGLFIGALSIGAIWFTDPLSLGVLWVFVLLWICFPAALIGITLLLAAARTGRSQRPGITILALVCGVACLFALVVPANNLVAEHRVSNAKAYPALVAPFLESYRKQNGSYPLSLDQLPTKPPLPSLMRRFKQYVSGYGVHESYPYHSDGQRYSFLFLETGDVFGEPWRYDSETREWYLPEGR